MRRAAVAADAVAEAAERMAELASGFTREGMLDEARAAEAASDADGAAARRAAATLILTAGMPLAALPVESLHRPWSSLSTELAAARGLYMGDSAHHLLAVYAECGIEVPQAFAAMPDHLALTAELIALLAKAGNGAGAAQIASDHLGWLDDYDAALADRAARVPAQDPESGALLSGIALLRGRLARIAELAAQIGKPSNHTDREQTENR